MMMYWSEVKKDKKLFSETFAKLRIACLQMNFRTCAIRYDARILNFFKREVEHVRRVLRYMNEKLF
jgi:hypothetical protein